MTRPRRTSTRSATEPLHAESDVQGAAVQASGHETRAPESIARRAYERCHARGGEHGRDQEDWFAAERELNNEPQE
jgi:hypothetical protein